jgi:hypothetical protein
MGTPPSKSVRLVTGGLCAEIVRVSFDFRTMPGAPSTPIRGPLLLALPSTGTVPGGNCQDLGCGTDEGGESVAGVDFFFGARMRGV